MAKSSLIPTSLGPADFCCTAIAACGEYIHDPVVREALVDLLVAVAKQHKWPTNFVISALRCVWGMGKD